jgi:hypothetical protein
MPIITRNPLAYTRTATGFTQAMASAQQNVSSKPTNYQPKAGSLLPESSAAPWNVNVQAGQTLSGIVRQFMQPYNEKVWAHHASVMSAGWIAERVALVSWQQALHSVVHRADQPGWGPNNLFAFPATGGTGHYGKSGCCRCHTGTRTGGGTSTKHTTNCGAKSGSKRIQRKTQNCWEQLFKAERFRQASLRVDGQFFAVGECKGVQTGDFVG